MGPSLLLSLLDGIDVKSYPNIQNDVLVQNNVSEVISSIKQNRPSLIKDIDQKELYNILYSTIENDEQKQENNGLNKLIDMVLAGAIEGRAPEIQRDIQELRHKLREKMIAALTPS